jgi:hypothetical protein
MYSGLVMRASEKALAAELEGFAAANSYSDPIG